MYKNYTTKDVLRTCTVHNLNLLFEDSIKPVLTFHEILQKLHLFFNASIKRWEILLDVMSITFVMNIKLIHFLFMMITKT